MKTMIASLTAAAVFLGVAASAGAGAAPPVRVVPTGGGDSVQCQGFGLELRGNAVRSCLLAVATELPVTAAEKIACAAKYATAFRSDGRVEYCTLARDATLRRTAQESVACKAGGRVVLRGDGTVESALLGETQEFPYANKATLFCRSNFAISFRSDGRVANCVLDREDTFVSGKKSQLKTTCKAGGLIAFDEDGRFNGCYPPPIPKNSKKPAPPNPGTDPPDPPSQGGQSI